MFSLGKQLIHCTIMQTFPDYNIRVNILKALLLKYCAARLDLLYETPFQKTIGKRIRREIR